MMPSSYRGDHMNENATNDEEMMKVMGLNA